MRYQVVTQVGWLKLLWVNQTYIHSSLGLHHSGDSANVLRRHTAPCCFVTLTEMSPFVIIAERLLVYRPS